MSNDDLGPMPEPEIQPGEPNPGGVDAITGEMEIPLVPDLEPALNPAVDEEAAPDDLSQGEDTSTQATEDDEEPMSGEQESPA
jgi:hypothetical protein